MDKNQWTTVIEFLEDQYPKEDARACLMKVSLDHIEWLVVNEPSLSQRLGRSYAQWIRENSFVFSDCDGLSIRLHKFILTSEIEIQAECLMAMLYLGTGHNRFYVEEKFVKLVDANLSNNLAERLAIEIEIDDSIAVNAIDHLKTSIKFDVKRLHPLLFTAYKKMSR
jgi:hypothetical protein